MYRWMVFLHIISVFGFLMAHGVSIAVYFLLRHERRLSNVTMLLKLSGTTLRIAVSSLLVLLVFGVVSGFLGKWWGQGWIWASLGVLVLIYVAMFMMGTRVFGELRFGLGVEARNKNAPVEATLTPEQVDSILSRLNPTAMSLIGFGGAAIITWLMYFKPF